MIASTMALYVSGMVERKAFEARGVVLVAFNDVYLLLHGSDPESGYVNECTRPDINRGKNKHFTEQ